MIKRPNTKAQRLHRHTRVRAKISGTPERPRLNVFRSNTNIYAQIIDDVAGVTLVSASTLDKSFEGATGKFEFDENRDPKMDLDVLQVQDGKWVPFA